MNQEEVPVHPGWLAGVEGDRALLHEVNQLTFYLMMKRYGLSLGMGIYLPADQFFPYQKQVLRIGPLGGGSNVCSSSYRSKKDVCAPFIRVTNQTQIRPAKRKK